jgi:hypothetical protein
MISPEVLQEIEQKIDFIKILDPRIHTNETRHMEIVVGGLNVTALTQSASTISSTTLNWQVVTPSPSCIMVRKMYVSYGVNLIDGNQSTAAPGTNDNSQCIFYDNFEGPRFRSLHSASSNLAFAINGINFAYQPDVIIENLAGQYDSFYDNTFESTCPQLNPQTLVLPSNAGYTYDGTTHVINGMNINTSIISPELVNSGNEFARDSGPVQFLAYGGVPFSYSPNMKFFASSSNNVFNYGGYYVQPAAGRPFNIQWFAAEPVIVPPLCHSNRQVAGLIGVNQFSLVFNLNVGRLWRSEMYDRGVNSQPVFRSMIPNPGVPNAFYTSVPGVTNTAPYLTMFFITPSPTQPMSVITTYPAYEILRFSTSTASAVALAAGSGPSYITSNVLSLQVIPSRFYIMAKQSIAGTTSTAFVPGSTTLNYSLYGAAYTSCAYNETCACIQNLSILFNNSSGLLSTCQVHDIYSLSKKNGLKTSFPHYTAGQFSNNSFGQICNPTPLVFKQGCGSTVCVSSYDLSMNSAIYAEGVQGVFQLTVQAGIYSPFFNPGGQLPVDLANVVPPAPGLPALDGSSYFNWDKPSQQGLQFQLFIVVMNPGVLQFNSVTGSFTKLIGNVTTQDVLTAPIMHADYFNWEQNFYGGRRLKMHGRGFLDDLLKGVKTAASIAKQAAPVVSGIASLIPHPAAQAVSKGANVAENVLGSLGFGKKKGRPKKRGGKALRAKDLLA